MKHIEINEEKILKSFQADMSERGKDLLVYDYFGRITTLENVEISYDVNGKYIPPKTYKIYKKTKQKNCIIC